MTELSFDPNDKRIPASIRYKNPGAMWGSKLAKKWGSTKTVQLNDGTGQGNNIAVFDTWVQGICAQLDLWRTSDHYRNKRFDEAIRVWSGGNHVESYIQYVFARVPGMERGTIMNDAFWRGPMGLAFLKAQAGHEAGRKYPAPDEDWPKAQQTVFNGAPISAPADVPPTRPPGPAQDTRWLQESLNKLGASPQLVVDGVVGPALRAVIRDYQRNNGLDADGLVGPATLREIAIDLANPEIKLPPPGQIRPGLAPTFWGRLTAMFKPKGA